MAARYAAAFLIFGLAGLWAAPLQAAGRFTITSPAFSDGEYLPRTFAGKGGAAACNGKNVSPPLRWKHAPKGTRSFALILAEQDGEGGNGAAVHWMVYGIPPSTMSLHEGAGNRRSVRFRTGLNALGTTRYAGPCPDKPGPRRYVVTIAALDIDGRQMPPGLTHAELADIVKRHQLGTATLTFRYPKPPAPASR